MRLLLKTIFQVVLFIILARISNFIVEWLHIPVPGSIVGIIIMFTLLKLKVLRLDWIEYGSKWLLSEMLLFFIPSTVAIINYKSLVIHSGARIALTILLSTIAVMICTGLMGQLFMLRKRRESR
ncbi:CidA/LrgA family holin-like protein [Paenibacillus radicis (ex Xue et al. 2023)]|uniref:CidA/LrgA family holin-like protein n=1 Tax=Paenibacillus radicis (ex Xue et al. 2023) TaxID=2972489 RepID=A0ABT1YEY2_9BACL|nr:CidA/LrgA family holin-like protein [Paenibacillus radicis (ex Xue et al. 2023)]MCR8630974.1 CidA/LrgA family holin-like protein [Paenibacillus radicis (ex Xue et al. 2023)]